MSGSSNWIYAVLDIFESPWHDLSIYQFIEGLVKNSWRYCVSKIGYSVQCTLYSILFFTPSLRCNISGSSDWIYAILDIFESPCLTLSMYQFIEVFVKNS